MKHDWTPATLDDLPQIVNMAESHFQIEIDTIFKPEPMVYARNLTHAMVNQHYSPLTELVSVAKDATGKIVAYTWAKANETSPWSDDNMVVIKMAHVDLTLPTKSRISLVNSMLKLWEGFALTARIPIICSTTMRKDQQGFLKLHERNGYDVRGSYAYKKLF